MIGAVLAGLAAAVNVLCLWQWDRPPLNVVATAVTVLAALLAAGGHSYGWGRGRLPRATSSPISCPTAVMPMVTRPA